MQDDVRAELGFSPSTVTRDFDGERLDRALVLCMPDASLRARRRVWDSCDVLVDGFSRGMSQRVQVGQELDVRPLARPGRGDELLGQVRVVAESEEYGAIFKPHGLHSVRLAGKPGAAAEDCLDALFAGRAARLVNRLDAPTSGILLVAFSSEAEQRFREWESAGRTEKTYHAVVRGEPDGMTINNRLDMANRKKTRVMDEPDPDPVRHTSIIPIDPGPLPGTALVRAVIKKGARHQIRAHLAHAGFPIVGDALYGGEAEAEAPRLYLHHTRLKIPGFEAACDPVWRG